MRRVLLVSSAEKGHLNPLIGVAQHLVREGVQVGWLCVPEALASLTELGVEPLGLQEQSSLSRLRERARVRVAPEPLTNLVRNPAALRAWIRDLLLTQVPAQLTMMVRAFERFRPDAIGLDPMLYAAILAAEQLRIPYAGISSSLNPVTPLEWECELTRTVASLADDRARLFSDHGLSPAFRVCDALSPAFNVVFSTETYVGPTPSGSTVHLVGPTAPIGKRGDEPDFPWERLDPKLPLIYVSFGSQIASQPLAFARIAEASASLGAQLVINTGRDCSAESIAGLPGRVVAVPYAPQLAPLEKAGAVVSHGGANSVMEALRAGVPLLLSPICNDQPLQARFLERSGAGRVLDMESAPIEMITQALASLLAESSPYPTALAPITASYRANDGARATALLLADLAR
jgi:zeaxanthin glucosyltransferase